MLAGDRVSLRRAPPHGLWGLKGRLFGGQQGRLWAGPWGFGLRPRRAPPPAPELAAPAAPAAQGLALNFSLLRRPGLGRYGSVPRDRPCDVPRKTEALDAKSTHSFIIDR